MKFSIQRRHVIDFVFPVSVLFVFAVSSLAVILLAADSYNSQIQDSADHYMTYTPLSYVSEKIHQNDQNGRISVLTLEGQSCLSLESQFDNDSYTTYIYEHEGLLKELFIHSQAEIHLSDGKAVMEVRDFTAEESQNGLFRFSSVDENGNANTLIISERSTP